MKLCVFLFIFVDFWFHINPFNTKFVEGNYSLLEISMVAAIEAVLSVGVGIRGPVHHVLHLCGLAILNGCHDGLLGGNLTSEVCVLDVQVCIDIAYETCSSIKLRVYVGLSKYVLQG